MVQVVKQTCTQTIALHCSRCVAFHPLAITTSLKRKPPLFLEHLLCARLILQTYILNSFNHHSNPVERALLFICFIYLLSHFADQRWSEANPARELSTWPLSTMRLMYISMGRHPARRQSTRLKTKSVCPRPHLLTISLHCLSMQLQET